MCYARDVVRAGWRYKRTCRSVRCFPEFREYYIHYPIKESNFSHYYAVRMAGSGKAILDVGCGEGFLASDLVKSGNRITGIDNRPAPCRPAAFERYFQADLDGGI